MDANEIVKALRTTVEIIDVPDDNPVLKKLMRNAANAADCIESLQARLAKAEDKMTAKAWNGCTVVCDCGSKNIKYLHDENCGALDDYAVYECRECGKRIYIELPN